MKLVIVRHGQTQANIINNNNAVLYTGSMDNEYTVLTEEGKRQAKKLREISSINQMNIMYSSDLSRAMETASIARPDLNVITDKRLRERSLGDFQGLSEKDLLNNKIYEKYITNENYNKFRRDFTQKAPNGENYTDVYNRVKSFFEDLDYKDDDVIGIFSHFNTIRCMFKYFFNLSNKEVLKLKINNCDDYLIDYDGKKYTLLENEFNFFKD